MACTLLLTGFNPFPGAPSNPSAAVVKAVTLRHANRLLRLGIQLRIAILPVVFSAIADALQQITSVSAPHAILHLGLAGRRRHISVELLARNKISQLHGDAARRTSGSRQVQAGPDQLRSTLPASVMVQALRARHLSTRLSQDAGDYVCNQTLYLSLLTGQNANIAAGFIHIPHLAAKRRQGATTRPRPRLDQLASALADALIKVAVLLRRL